VLTLAAQVALLTLATRAAAQRLETRPSRSASGPISGKHCLDESKQKLLLNHYLAGSINPLGIGQFLRLSLCTPLVTRPGLLFDLTNVEFGVLLTNTPTNVSFGGFINLVPLSFLVLRAEADVFYIWPTPLQGAGFITLDNARSFNLDALSPSPFGPTPARTAVGGRFLLGATLRGEVALGKRLSLAVADVFNAEYWRVSDGTWAEAQSRGHSVFYVARRDVVVNGPGDFVLLNTAALLLGIKVHPNVTLRLGITDDLAYVPSQAETANYSCASGTPDAATLEYQPSRGYLGNVAAGLAVLSIKNLRGLARDFSLFARFGGFTHHAFRECSGAAIALGADVTYELFSRPHSRPALPAEPPPQAPPMPAEPQAVSPAAPAEVVPRPPQAPVDPPQPMPKVPAEPAAPGLPQG